VSWSRLVAHVHRCRRHRNHGPDAIRAMVLASRDLLVEAKVFRLPRAAAALRAISIAEADFAQGLLIGNQEIFDPDFLLHLPSTAASAAT